MSENPVWLLITSAYALLGTWVLCIFAARVAKRFRLYDRPSDIKKHENPTPLMGGAALLLVIIPIMPILMLLFEPAGVGNWALTIIVMATLACAIIGMLDDRDGLSPIFRLFFAIAVFGLALALDNRLMITDVRVTGWVETLQLPRWGAWVFSVATLLGFLNAVNMADGKNGLVIGLSLVWTFFLTILGPPGMVIVMLPVLLMLCVLMMFNLRGEIFLGDGGSYGLATFFSLTAIYSYNVPGSGVMADMLALLFLVPGLDMVRLFFVRIVARRSPFSGDRDHLHHHLLNLLGWPGGLLLYLLLMSALPALGLLMPRLMPYLIVATVALYFTILLIARRHRSTEASPSRV